MDAFLFRRISAHDADFLVPQLKECRSQAPCSARVAVRNGTTDEEFLGNFTIGHAPAMRIVFAYDHALQRATPASYSWQTPSALDQSHEGAHIHYSLVGMIPGDDGPEQASQPGTLLLSGTAALTVEVPGDPAKNQPQLSLSPAMPNYFTVELPRAAVESIAGKRLLIDLIRPSSAVHNDVQLNSHMADGTHPSAVRIADFNLGGLP